MAQDDSEVEVADDDNAPSESYGDEESIELEEQGPQQYVSPAQDVSTWVKFIGVPEQDKFIAGDEVTALIGLHNSGQTTYNISYVGAHLHSPYDEKFYVQNFTVRWLAALLPPQSEVTVEYKFRPDEKLETLDFLLSGWLIYNDSQPTPVIYRSLFHNSTIEVQERRFGWNLQSALTYALGFAGVAVVGYAIAQQQGGVGKLTQSVLGKKSKKSRRDPAASPEAEGSPVAAGWETKVYKPAAVQKAVGSKKSQKPPSKK
jgi:hypothetical protein